MGYWKRMMEEEEARGYTDAPDTWVCSQCVRDDYLRSVLASAATAHRCSFCSSKQASEFSVLLDCLVSTVRTYYSDPAEELPYESAEGGYQGDVIDTREALEALGEWTDNSAILDLAVNSMPDSAWCKRDYFGLSTYEQLRYGWDAFVNQVRHKTRHLFFSRPTSWHSRHSDGIRPQEMLRELGALFQDQGLFTTLEPTQELKRARVVKVGERPSTAQDLGTVPERLATMPNRMSPAGIPMFYAGIDADTAIAETYDPRRARGREIVMATFQPTRPLRLLNLKGSPPVPSLFDPESRTTRDPIRFLRDFVTDICKPVERDRMAHTEYVATQVVTEYVRHRLTENNQRIDGILYPSSRHATGTAVVVFATSEQCRERNAFEVHEQLLRLVGVEHVMPPRRRRKPR